MSMNGPLRTPYDADAVLGWLGNRAVAGIEELDGGSYRRTLTLPGGMSVVGDFLHGPRNRPVADEKLDLLQIASLHFIFPTRRRKGLQHNDD